MKYIALLVFLTLFVGCGRQMNTISSQQAVAETRISGTSNVLVTKIEEAIGVPYTEATLRLQGRETSLADAQAYEADNFVGLDSYLDMLAAQSGHPTQMTGTVSHGDRSHTITFTRGRFDIWDVTIGN